MEITTRTYYVCRNGVKRAGPFKNESDAKSHALNMRQVSISLQKFRDDWSVISEKEEKTIDDNSIEAAKLKRAQEREARLEAEIAKSRKQAAAIARRKIG